MPDIINIGNSINLSPRIDPTGRMTEYIRDSMIILDLIPCVQTVNVFGAIKDPKNIVGFKLQTDEYSKLCKNYKLDPAKALRVWCTDETIMQDDLSNSYNDSLIGRGLTSVSSKIRGIIPGGGAILAGSKSSNDIKNIISGAIKLASEFVGNVTSESIGNLINAAGDVIFEGQQFSLPKVWDQSTYNPSFTANIKLISPYGSPESVFEFIIKPLAYLLLLISPHSKGGITYGYPFSVYVKAYGIANIKSGFVQSVSIRRGGADLNYNQYRQPMMLNISLTLAPMADGFASLSEGDVASLSNAADRSISKPGGNTSFVSVNDMLQSFQPVRYNPDSDGIIPTQTASALTSSADQSETPNTSNIDASIDYALA